MKGQPHILLVEDEDNIAIALEVLLGREGYAVTRIADGAQAVQRVIAARPALAILDVSLPGKSGFEICQDLRAEPATARLPILMMSARASPPEQRKGLALGADRFLTKPFAIDELRRAVAELIAGAEHAD